MAYYTADHLDFIVGVFGLLVSILFFVPLFQSFLQFRDPKFKEKVALPILMSGYASMILFMTCAMNLSIERMLLVSYDYNELEEGTFRSIAESTYIWGKLCLYVLFLARLHYSFQALPHLDYKKEVKIAFILIALCLATIFWIASLIVGNDPIGFQATFEQMALAYYICDAIFTIFALYLFNKKLNDLVTSKENLKRQITTQQSQNIAISKEEAKKQRKMDKRSEKLVDTMVRYTVLVIVAVATSWIIAINFILVVSGVYFGKDAFFFKQGTLLIVDTLVNFICVWLNFKFSSQFYEFLCECKCPKCTYCDFHGYIKKWYFERNGFVYEKTVALQTKLNKKKGTIDTETDTNITNRDGRSHAIMIASTSNTNKSATESSVASSMQDSRWLD